MEAKSTDGIKMINNYVKPDHIAVRANDTEYKMQFHSNTNIFVEEILSTSESIIIDRLIM